MPAPFDETGDDIGARTLRRDDQMDAGGAAELRDAADRILNVIRRDHHQVGKLVDDDDQLRDPLLGIVHQRVVTRKLARADFAEFLIAHRHFVDRPAERACRLLRLGHDRDEKVRQRTEDGELDHLRVDEDQLKILRRGFVDHRNDQVVDTDGFAGTGGACDQHMRHLAEIGDDDLARNILAERHRDRGLRVHELLAVDDVTQKHGRGVLVRHLDADCCLAGDRCFDAHARRGERKRDVVT